MPTSLEPLALSFPHAIEAGHQGHPDFRVEGKILASLGPDGSWGMVKLTPEQEQVFGRTEPGVFRPATGAWVRRGARWVTLEAASEAAVRQALDAAWCHTAPKKLRQKRRDDA